MGVSRSGRAPVFTVGHSTHDFQRFAALLDRQRVEAVVDVRWFPGSRRSPQLGVAPLAHGLDRAGIACLDLLTLGGRYSPLANSPNTAWRNTSLHGCADRATTAKLAVGFEALVQLCQDNVVAPLCAEGAWWRCHRRLLADRLAVAGL